MLMHTIGRVMRKLAAGIQFLGGFSALTDGLPHTNKAQYSSIDFTNAGEYMRGATSTLGAANAWTIEVWAYPSSLTTAMFLFDMYNGSDNSNRIYCDMDTGGDMYLSLYDSSGTLVKRYEWLDTSAGMPVNEWWQWVFTWDGSTLKGYSGGVERTRDTAHTDGSGTMTDTSRIVTVGCDNAGANAYQGRIHRIAMWDSVLTADEVKAVFNRGDAANMDLDTNQEAYASAANLVHWWKLGHTPSDLGKDYVASGGIDLDASSSGIDWSDVRCDAPNGMHLNFNGNTGGGAATEYLLNSTGQAYGIADSYTIAMWHQMVTVPTSQRQVLFEITDDTTIDKERCAIIIDATARDYGFLVGDASATTQTVLSGKISRVAEWYHVVAVKDGTSEQSIWVNGVKAGTTGATIPTQTDEADRICGVAVNALDGQDAGDCRVQSVMIWDEALGDAEIISLYNKARSHVNPEVNYDNYTSAANLVHYWQMGVPPPTGDAGSANFVRAVVGGVDLAANDAGVGHRNDSRNDGPMGRFINFGDNAADRMENTSVAAVGIANQWSVSFWMNQRVAPTAFETSLDFRSGTNGSIMQLGFDGTITGNPLSCALTDTGPTLFTPLAFTDTDSDDGSWHHYVVTFDGTDTGDPLLGYRNGVVSVSSGTDTTGTMADANREICLADSVLNTTPNAYQLGQFAVWDAVLTPNEIRSITSHSWDADLSVDFLDYASSANLQHWWKIGENQDNIGEDTGSGTARDLTPNSITYESESLAAHPFRRT
jgi:hypothetical protein